MLRMMLQSEPDSFSAFKKSGQFLKKQTTKKNDELEDFLQEIHREKRLNKLRKSKKSLYLSQKKSVPPLIHDSSILIAPMKSSMYNTSMGSTGSMVQQSKCHFYNFKKPSKSPLPSLKKQISHSSHNQDWGMSPEARRGKGENYQTLSPFPKKYGKTMMNSSRDQLSTDITHKSRRRFHQGSTFLSSQNSLRDVKIHQE